MQDFFLGHCRSTAFRQYGLFLPDLSYSDSATPLLSSICGGRICWRRQLWAAPCERRRRSMIDDGSWRRYFSPAPGFRGILLFCPRFVAGGTHDEFLGFLPHHHADNVVCYTASDLFGTFGFALFSGGGVNCIRASSIGPPMGSRVALWPCARSDPPQRALQTSCHLHPNARSTNFGFLLCPLLFMP